MEGIMKAKVHSLVCGFRLCRFRAFSVLMSCLLVVVVLSLTVVLGCTDKKPVAYFPVQKARLNAYPAALAEGRLVVFDEALYLEIELPGLVYRNLLIWPPGFSFRVDGDSITVLDESQKVAAVVGDNITVGGGEISAVMVNELASPSLPGGLADPYWIVSRLIEN
jgi:hypothetical protein